MGGVIFGQPVAGGDGGVSDTQLDDAVSRGEGGLLLLQAPAAGVLQDVLNTLDHLGDQRPEGGPPVKVRQQRSLGRDDREGQKMTRRAVTAAVPLNYRECFVWIQLLMRAILIQKIGIVNKQPVLIIG